MKGTLEHYWHLVFATYMILGEKISHIKDEEMRSFITRCKRGGLCTTGMSKIAFATAVTKHIPSIISMVKILHTTRLAASLVIMFSITIEELEEKKRS